jgi:cytochrome P450
MSLPPGPRQPAVIQTARFIGRPVPFMESCRERFGDTFTLRAARVGRLVLISDPASLKALFSADRHNTIASQRNLILAPLLGERSLLVLEGEEHLSRRKMMLPPFHGERLRAYESMIEQAADRELASWRLGAPFRLHPAMQAITLEVIMRAVFGVTEERRGELRARLLEILAATRSPAAIAFTVAGLRRLPRFRRLQRTIDRVDELLAAEIAEHRADPGLAQREDILALLISARDQHGEGMSDAELRDQLMTLLLAGHETTATALAWAFDLLLRDPEAHRRLRDEVDAGEGHDYLDAVIEESLRLRPVVPFVGRELRRAAVLDGYSLPVGTTVMASIYLAHTRAESYPDPHEFRPERFLDGAPGTFSWVPFGGGTRRCIGAAFAQLEMRVVLRTVLRGVELSAAGPEPEQIVRRNVTLSPRHGTPAIARGRRERARALSKARPA